MSNHITVKIKAFSKTFLLNLQTMLPSHGRCFSSIPYCLSVTSVSVHCLQVRQRVRLQQPCVRPGPAHVLQGVKSRQDSAFLPMIPSSFNCNWMLCHPPPGASIFYDKLLLYVQLINIIIKIIPFYMIKSPLLCPAVRTAASSVCRDDFPSLNCIVLNGLVALNMHTGSFALNMIIKSSVCGKTCSFMMYFVHAVIIMYTYIQTISLFLLF